MGKKVGRKKRDPFGLQQNSWHYPFNIERRLFCRAFSSEDKINYLGIHHNLCVSCPSHIRHCSVVVPHNSDIPLDCFEHIGTEMWFPQDEESDDLLTQPTMRLTSWAPEDENKSLGLGFNLN